MAEEITNTVKNVSDGTVTIAIERYQELMEKAAEKAPVVYRTVQKTPAMVADEHRVWGGLIMASGIAATVIGGFMYANGVKLAKDISNLKNPSSL